MSTGDSEGFSWGDSPATLAFLVPSHALAFLVPSHGGPASAGAGGVVDEGDRLPPLPLPQTSGLRS